MIIRSEQEMIEYGRQFAKRIFSSDNSPSDKPLNQYISEKEKLAGPAKKAIVIELIGDVGAGKTTFTRGLAEGLEAGSSVTSPSFTISKQYALKNGGRLIHYDFYRLQDPGIMSEDLKESFENPNNVTVIEWSNSVSDILPDNRTIIEFQKNDDDSRCITIKNPDSDPRDIATKNTNPTNYHQPSKTDDLPPTLTATDKNKLSNQHPLKLYLDTSSPETILGLNETEFMYDFGRDLAEKLLSWIHEKLQDINKDFKDITEITFMSGPGSFTGLRIGAAIVNTLAHELKIPLKDRHGNFCPIIIPNYGRPANISKPKK